MPDIPRHIAIVMDGNGRWAESRGLARTLGHAAGAIAARRVVVRCAEMGVGALTLYSFSSENWNRPQPEVDALMELAYERLYSERQTMIDNGIALRHLGRRDGLPAKVLEQLDACEAATSGGARMTLCLAINYGARAEIVDAARALARRVQSGALKPEEIDEDAISDALYTSGLPDPDLLIRTAGQMRLSNYLLWQLSYAELLVTPTLWPDFDEGCLAAACQEFANRTRTFGGLPSTST